MILRGAVLGDLLIGLTSDQYTASKNYHVPPYSDRKRKLENYLIGENIRFEIRELSDPFGSTLDSTSEAIMASNETFDFCREINFIRSSRGLNPLHIENIGTVLADDFLPIKSERIVKGEIDEEGKRLNKIRIALSSGNQEKLQGTKLFFSKIFSDFEIDKFHNRSNFPSQPMNEEILYGALKRLNDIQGGYDYYVGIEAGVISISGKNFDIHLAAIKDCYDKITYGISSGLFLEEHLIQGLRNGEELEEVVDKMLKLKNSGEDKGAIYYLSGGLKKRNELVQEALLSAFTERLGSRLPKTSND